MDEVEHIVGRLDKNGHRFVANHGDEATLKTLVDLGLEPIRLRRVVRKGKDRRNLFYIKADTKL